MGGLSIWHWIIVLVVVLLVFGTKRLRNAGQDLGEAVKGFKKGMKDDDDKPAGQIGDQSRTDASSQPRPASRRTATATPTDRPGATRPCSASAAANCSSSPSSP